jgi:hypothetical protein
MNTCLTVNKLFLGKIIYSSNVSNLIYQNVIDKHDIIENLYKHSINENYSHDLIDNIEILRKTIFEIYDIKFKIITESNNGFISTSILLDYIDN